MAKQDEVTQQAGVRQQDGVQPGLGAGVHKTKTSSWVTMVLLVAGVILGFTGKIMDNAH